ncbi:hypothetical protein BDP27DRAFT_1239749 [Rhodocollybia butyracea]|uniref:DUF7918 domain-containing protein n=1 Tax=Rhodocollybia butyracea TaxID=206335 RepID=A0A9P5P9C3_9AGAR|nr:hypothetical protein BDP27DRAFT_1239749 [Rhodocollybia butyracea]
MVLFLDEFSAWVTIDGQELQEYRPQHKPKKNLLACWIASVAGKNFQIHWRDSKRHTATDGHCRIDGNPCGGKVISCDADKPAFAIKSYMRTGPTTLKPFKFSDVQLTGTSNI